MCVCAVWECYSLHHSYLDHSINFDVKIYHTYWSALIFEKENYYFEIDVVPHQQREFENIWFNITGKINPKKCERLQWKTAVSNSKWNNFCGLETICFFFSFKQAFCSIFGINLECQEIRTIPSLLIAINFAFCLYCCLKFSPLENWDFYRCSSAYAFQSYTPKNCNSSSINLIRLIFSLWIKISNAHLVKLIFEHATLLIGLASFFRYQIIWRSYQMIGILRWLFLPSSGNAREQMKLLVRERERKHITRNYADQYILAAHMSDVRILLAK